MPRDKYAGGIKQFGIRHLNEKKRYDSKIDSQSNKDRKLLKETLRQTAKVHGTEQPKNKRKRKSDEQHPDRNNMQGKSYRLEKLYEPIWRGSPRRYRRIKERHNTFLFRTAKPAS